MAQKNQGGSVLGFIIVAIVMAGLLIGGAYAVRQLTSQPQQAVEPSPTEAKDSQKDQQEAKKPAAGESKKSDSPQPQNNASEDTKHAAELPKTGAEGLLGPAIMMGILSGMVVSYVRSRRLEPSF
jgi:LPXTG-motif cell wall-anchored protein